MNCDDVALVGLEGEHATHNGQSATIFDFDEASNLYGVELVSGDAIPAAVGAVRLSAVAIGGGASGGRGSSGRSTSHSPRLALRVRQAVEPLPPFDRASTPSTAAGLCAGLGGPGSWPWRTVSPLNFTRAHIN